MPTFTKRVIRGILQELKNGIFEGHGSGGLKLVDDSKTPEVGECVPPTFVTVEESLQMVLWNIFSFLLCF